MILPCEPLTSLPSVSSSHMNEASVDIWWWAHGGRVDWLNGSLVLSEEEQKRAETFRFARDAASFVAGRHLRRCALSAYAGIARLDLMFTTGRWGKPELVVPAGHQPLAFNLSNTQGLAVVAVSRDCHCVGIDAEPLSATIESQATTLICSTAEISALSALQGDERRQQLLAYWVMKESFLKARGTGLVAELNRISVTTDPRAIRINAGLNDQTSWQHRLVTTQCGHLIAVSAKVEQAALVFRQQQLPYPGMPQ